ncbi:MAG: hypothetical protein IT385_03495 [Deltaproteobacteria bacterium]|nr:hypothetical protein [Deltaproteobacteria bacterium]
MERHVDPTSWAVVQRDDVDVAWSEANLKPPDLVVLNADVGKGWNLCAQLKRRFPALPVVLLSYKANKELFNNHQKLPTRADAYHHLPDEIDGVAISLSYYSSHKAEIEEEEAQQPRRQRSSSRVTVPTGVVQNLEQTVRDQAREMEGLKRQIEALEAERDAVSEKARRQMMELMSVAAPGPDLSGEVAITKRRVAELEAELESARAITRDATDRALELQESLRQVTAAAESAQSEMIALRAHTRAAGNTAEQISLLSAQLAQADQRRAAAEAARAAAEERATTAERAWAGINTRAEELHQALQLRGLDVERVTKEKADVETTLAMSRKLMKDYISEAARNAEAARVANERCRELEEGAAAVDARIATIQSELDFQRSLVESLEGTQREAATQVAEREAAAAAERSRLEARIAELEAEVVRTREAGSGDAARVQQLEEEIARRQNDAGSLGQRLTALRTELAAVNEAAANYRQANEAAAAAAYERFEALKAWAKRVDLRLHQAEATRDAVLARLQALVDDLNAAPSGRIEPPPMSLEPA